MVSSDGPAADQAPILGTLLLRSLIQAQGADQIGLLRLVAKAAETLSSCRIMGVLLDGAWQDVGRGGIGLGSADVTRIGSTPQGGPIAVDGADWAWVYPMPIATDHLGYLVVAAGDEPGASDRRLLPALARGAGLAVANMRARLAEQARVAELRAESADLRRGLEIRDRLAAQLLRVGGQQGIARAVHELTGHPAWIEDGFGNVIAWAGAGPINSFPPGGRDRSARRQVKPKAAPEAGIVRERDLLISTARLAGKPVGAVVLVDPGQTAGAAEQAAIEFAGTMLAMEVSRAQRPGEPPDRVAGAHHERRATRPATGWASLTDKERQVVELVAQGLSNREVARRLFLSAHTVAFHLRHVFQKLSIGSRVQLARLVAEKAVPAWGDDPRTPGVRG